MSSNRRISRSTTTAYSPSLPPKCSYTTGFETPALCAISSTEVPSNPRSAYRVRPRSRSCARRALPCIRTRRARREPDAEPLAPPLEELPPPSLTRQSCRLAHVVLTPGGDPVRARPPHVVRPAQPLQPA